MIVDKAVYAGGRRHECPDAAAGLADARRRNEAGGPESERAFVWVGLFEPTGDEVREFTELFAMHPLMVEDIVTTGLSSRECIAAIREHTGELLGAAWDAGQGAQHQGRGDGDGAVELVADRKG